MNLLLKKWLLLLLPGLAVCQAVWAQEWAGVDNTERARYHWIMHCQGCHGVQAQGAPGGAPRMAGVVSKFLHNEAGRAYLSRVPGVAFVSLSNRDVAELMNWVVQTFDAQNLPEHFKPYTEDEMKNLRQQPLISQAFRVRKKILQNLKKKRE